MSAIEKAWYEGAWWLYLLLPLSWLFRLIAALRRSALSKADQAESFAAPIVVVGNLTVGGTGKTPLILALVKEFKRSGLRVGVVSRGYGAAATSFPLQVNAGHTAEQVGDEPMLIYQAADCPVVIDPDRTRACKALLENNKVDVILSDDGLQHYAMPRDVELVVVDGERRFGNGHCLPAGPLREPVSRLRSVDAILVNNGMQDPGPDPDITALAGETPVFAMRLWARMLHNLKTDERRPFSGAPFKMGDRVQAVAGIGNPQRFFKLVDELPYTVEHFAFPDHHPYQENDLIAAGIDLSRPIVMTEKDGIKCGAFANENFWVVHIEIELPETFTTFITDLVADCQARRKRSASPSAGGN